ncbi:MAG: hypothetical protein JWP27_1589, partial [Flaviaesturariibacter sp.]|nr:hypothetical protein [Flaviaesturariibacter sp.]
FSKAPSIGVSAGFVNYEGDLKPNSFTFSQSHPYLSFYVVKPLHNRVSLRAGAGVGALEAADRNNRGYLVPRNLSFQTSLKEAYAGLELYFFNREKARFAPYVFAGAAVFHVNPWARDRDGSKVYLQPLGTEGQGLEAYPGRTPYALTQYALCMAGGVKFELSPSVTIGWELSQRKTFTDYIDDVSSSYVDRQELLAARGPVAADMAFRGDEIDADSHYPAAGEQRGTPTENDWYYFFGVTLEVRMSAVKSKIASIRRGKPGRRIQRCPSIF